MLYKKSLYDEGKEKKMTEKALESYMDTVEEIRQIPINDIYADLTGHSVHMRAKVCCIVHNDHDPSMGFARGNDGYFYHCFSCGASGDAVKMTMILRGIRWTEAVRYLANRYNIPIRQDFREKSDPFPFTRDHLEFLGLMPGISCGSCIRGCVPSKDMLPSGRNVYTAPDTMGFDYVYGTKERFSMQKLWAGDDTFGSKEECRQMVLSMIIGKLMDRTTFFLSQYRQQVWNLPVFRESKQLIQESVMYGINEAYEILDILKDQFPGEKRLAFFPPKPDLSPVVTRKVQIAF